MNSGGKNRTNTECIQTAGYGNQQDLVVGTWVGGDDRAFTFKADCEDKEDVPHGYIESKIYGKSLC